MSTTEPVDTLEATGAYPEYDEYEDSGVKWLGEIPSRWTTAKLKYCIQSLVSGATPKSTEDEYWASDNEEGTPWVAVGDMSEASWVNDTEKRVTKEGIDEADLETLPQGTLLYSIYASLGEVAVLDVPATTNQAILGITPDRDLITRDFLYYWLRHMQRHVEVLSSSNTQDNLSAGRVRNMPVYLPEVQEQRSIATFLDRETGRIDALIEKKEQLIDLLEEKRTALISRVVTKGLDPDVEMQDSGVEWLGEIPAHWDTVKLKFLTEDIIDAEHKTAPFYPDGDYLVVRTSNIRKGELRMGDAKFTDEEGFREWTQRGTPEPGDILLTREAPAGEACVVPKGIDMCLGQRVVLLRIKENVLDPSFCVYALYSGVTDEFISMLSQGSTVDHFNISDIASLPVLLPSLREQHRIAEHLRQEIEKINALTDKIESGIERLKEYRTALISAAVTGQIDVREKVGL